MANLYRFQDNDVVNDTQKVAISTWTNNAAFNSSNPNQPCNHICKRIQFWTNKITTVGPVQADILQCKLDEGSIQASIYGCGCGKPTGSLSKEKPKDYIDDETFTCFCHD